MRELLRYVTSVTQIPNKVLYISRIGILKYCYVDDKIHKIEYRNYNKTNRIRIYIHDDVYDDVSCNNTYNYGGVGVFSHDKLVIKKYITKSATKRKKKKNHRVIKKKIISDIEIEIGITIRTDGTLEVCETHTDRVLPYNYISTAFRMLLDGKYYDLLSVINQVAYFKSY
jgi:hypothetical protein